MDEWDDDRWRRAITSKPAAHSTRQQLETSVSRDPPKLQESLQTATLAQEGWPAALFIALGSQQRQKPSQNTKDAATWHEPLATAVRAVLAPLVRRPTCPLPFVQVPGCGRHPASECPPGSRAPTHRGPAGAGQRPCPGGSQSDNGVGEVGGGERLGKGTSGWPRSSRGTIEAHENRLKQTTDYCLPAMQ